MHSSSVSARRRAPTEALGARLEWRPSRLLVVFLGLLGTLAAIAIVLSDMPRIAAWPAACVAMAAGIAMARRDWRQRPRDVLVIPTEDGSRIDGAPVRALAIAWRGPLAFLSWRDEAGRLQRLSFWPDTLSAAQRRELRLAAPMPVAAPASASMAP